MFLAPASPEARALGVSTLYLAEREKEGLPKEGRRRIELGKRKKPPSQSKERNQRVGVYRRHTSIPHAPGAAEVLRRLERHGDDRWTTIPRRRRGAAPTASRSACASGFFQLRPPRAKLQFPGGLARGGLEVGSLEVTRATSELAASPASGADLNAAVGPAGRAAGTPRYVARAGLALRPGQRGVDVQSDLEGYGRATGRTAGCGHRLLGAAAALALRTWLDACPHASTFQASYLGAVAESAGRVW